MGTYAAEVADHLVIPAQVGLAPGEQHFRRHAGRPVHAPIAVRMLIDTGSSRTSLIPGIIRHLDADAGPEVNLNTPSGQRRVSLYWLRLEFPEAGLAPFEHLEVASLAMPPALAQFHGLIGRDVLRAWEEFRYRGRRGRYRIRDVPGWFGRFWPGG